MIICCPACQARFRLDRQRLGGKRVTLRCSRCRETFKTEVPAPTGAARFTVLVAHGDPSLCTTIHDLLGAEGIDCRVEHDGTGALRQMQLQPPQVAILDVAISGLYIFELIEKMRGLPRLTETKILLLSSIYSKTAYKRTPSSLYGADDYIEKHHIPDDLVPKVYRLALQAVPVPDQQAKQEKTITGQALTEAEKSAENSSRELNAHIQRAENEDLAVPDTAIEKARQLARIIAADIALYNQEKMDEGIRRQNVFDLLAGEIEEGRRIFRKRLAPGFSSQEDFVRQAVVELVERRRCELGG